MQFLCNEDGEREAVVIPIEELERNYYKRRFYKYSIKGVSAKGYCKEGSFFICADSTIKGDLSGNGSFASVNRDRIKRFLEDGSIANEGKYYRVIKDISTGKDSVAACLVAGGSQSGNTSRWCC